MFNRIFPQKKLNKYRGNPVAKWVLAILTIVTLARSLVHMFSPDGGAEHRDDPPGQLHAEWGGNGHLDVCSLGAIAASHWDSLRGCIVAVQGAHPSDVPTHAH